MTEPMTPPTWKRRLAFILASLGLVGLALSLFTLYVGRILGQDDAFANRVSASLDDPRVGEFVALKITDALVAQKPDLTPFRPVLVVVTRGVVTSPPFRALLRPAVRQVHAALMSSTTENLLLAIPDAQVLVQEALANVGGNAAAKLPPRLAPVLEIGAGAPAIRLASGVLNTARALRPFGRISLLVAVLMLAAAVALAPSRRSALLSVGIGVATVGFVIALSVPAGRLLANSILQDPATAAAAAGLWDAFFGSLRIAGLVVALIGASVALIARSGEGMDVRAIRQQLWALATERRANTLAEVGRLVGLALAGLVAVLEPGLAIALVAMIAGAVLVLLSLMGARRLVQAYLPANLRVGTEEARAEPLVWAGVRVIVLLGLGVGAASVLLRLRPPPAVIASGGECNGAVELCSRRFNKVTFAGAHNAMGAATNATWLFPNQDLDIPQLLDRGVRAFLLDPYRGNPLGDRIKTDFDVVEHARRKTAEVIGEEAWAAGMRVRERMLGEPGPSGVYLCHGYCELGAIPFVPTLRQFVEFLVVHPSEVIIISFEDNVPPKDIVAGFEESGLLDFVYRGPLGPTWPTLDEMIASGGRVVVLVDTDVGDVPWLHHSMGGLVTETEYTFRTPAQFNCKPKRGTPTGELFLINHWIETTPAPRPSNAEIVNQRDVLLRRARQCERERGMKPNIFAVDFAGIGDLIGAVRVLNGLPPDR